MAPLPKRKRSKSSKGHHKSHQALSPVSMGNCPNCGSVKAPHRACQACGYYNGRQVIKVGTPEAE